MGAIEIQNIVYPLFTFFLDGFDGGRRKNKIISELASVKTPSKLRQKFKKLTDRIKNAIGDIGFLTVRNILYIKILTRYSVNLRQIVKFVLTEAKTLCIN